MLPETTSTDEGFEKKVDEEANGQKSVSLSNENEGKHDKADDPQGQAYEKKAEHDVVEAEKSEDSSAIEAFTEDNVKHDKVEDAQEDEKKAEAGVIFVEKLDGSLSSEAAVADNLKEKELIPDSQIISVIEPAPDAAKSQPEEPLLTESTESIEKDEEQQPKTDNIPEASTETIEEISNPAEAIPLIESEVKLVKETEYLDTSSQKVDRPEPAVTEEQEKSEEPEKESEDKAQEIELPNTVAISDPSAETNEKPYVEQPKKVAIPDPSAETKDTLSASDAIENPEPEVPEVQQKPEEPVKGSQEKLQDAKQPNTVAVSDPSVETNEKTSDAIEKPKPIVTEVYENSEETEKESQEKPQEAEQPNTAVVSDRSVETDEKPSDATEKPEPIVTAVHEKSQETEKESQEKPQEAEKTNTIAVSDPSAETNGELSETIEKPEPNVTEVDEKSEETQKNSQEKSQDAEQAKTVAIPDSSVETSEKLGDVREEKTRDPNFVGELSKETNNSEAGPTETEKAEHAVTEIKENPSEPEKQSFEKEEEEQLKTVIIHQTESENEEKPDDIVEVHPPQDSDIEVVKVSGNSNLEAVPVNAEKAEHVSPEVEEKPREQIETAEIIGETAKIKEILDDTIKEPTSLKVEKIDKAEETSIKENRAQVSLNEEAQAATANLVESSPAVAEKVVEGDSKKESSCANEIDGVSKEVVGVLKDPEQTFINQEAKTDLKEEREYSAPISIDEAVAANEEDKKQPSAPDAAKGSSREVEMEIKKVEEQNEAMTATIEEGGGVKAESVKDDNEKTGQPETKVDEGASATAVSEQVRETLASKLEEKEEESIQTVVDNLEKVQIEDTVKTEVQTQEPPTKESDATKSSKDLPKETPAKATQKQSNNILSKVKQSLVRAKKAITGKSPTSKTISSEAKGDIKVK